MVKTLRRNPGLLIASWLSSSSHSGARPTPPTLLPFTFIYSGSGLCLLVRSRGFGLTGSVSESELNPFAVDDNRFPSSMGISSGRPRFLCRLLPLGGLVSRLLRIVGEWRSLLNEAKSKLLSSDSDFVRDIFR
uniref:Uncharacterized protein n=1 Tax=Anopheles merus TaxID=30066 RepID=A0A182V761_ANOME